LIPIFGYHFLSASDYRICAVYVLLTLLMFIFATSYWRSLRELLPAGKSGDMPLMSGIARDRLTAAGKGQTAPIADNATDEGRATNARSEFLKI
jgi:hypothetical protein